MKSDITGKRLNVLILAVILLVGLVFRIAYLYQLHVSGMVEVIFLDSRFYRDLALQISSGGGLPGGAVTYNPLYPLFLAAVFRLFEQGIFAARIVQAVLGLLTVVMIYSAGCRFIAQDKRSYISARAVGLMAAAIAVLNPHLLFFEGNLVAVSLVTFLLTASFSLALAIDQSGGGVGTLKLGPIRINRTLSCLVLGAIIGAGASGRPNLFLILAVAVPIWLFIRNRSRPGGYRTALACIAGSVLLLIPPLLYGASQTGRLVPVSTSGGINFYIGNRPGANGTFEAPAGMRADMQGMFEDARKAAGDITGRELTHAEASRFWFGRTLGEIRDNPAGWIRLLARKLLLFWNGTEVATILDISFYREPCPVLALPFFTFALISPLSLIGLIVLWRGGRNRSVVFLFVLAGLASVLPFFITSRYRLPIIPVLMICSAVFIYWVVSEILRRRWKYPILSILLFVTLLLVVSTRSMVEVNRSAGYTFLGNHFKQAGEEERAADAYEKAFRLDPGRVETRINYARSLAKRGEHGRALELYSSSFKSRPDFPYLALEYGSLLEQMQRGDDARKLYLYATSLPRKAEQVMAFKLLSRMAYSNKNRDEAISWIGKALEIAPGDEGLIRLLNMLEGDR